MRAAPWAALALATFSCSKSGTSEPSPETVTVSASGTVFLASGTAPPSKLAGAGVKLAVGNSTVASTQSDANGAYVLQGSVAPGSLVVVSFESSGAAPMYRTVQAKGQVQATFNATLHPLESLACNAGDCALGNGKLALSGLPDGASGSARVFNPATEASAFPGSFSDDKGNLLVSGVFANVQLTDSGGQPIRTTQSPVELTMALPRDTWPLVQDVVPATADKVEVPLFSFDEKSGTWKQDGQGVLVDDGGALINATSDLASVVAGTWTKGVNARGLVSHFSYWNVDWPIDKHTCVTARIVVDGKPATGAAVSVRGTTYTGTSAGSSVGADGTFCADVMRSEGGQTQKVEVIVTYGGDVYAFGPFDTSSTQATCGSGGCADLGDLTLGAASKLAVSDCTLTGKVMNKAGAGLADATVIAFDESVPDAALQARCQIDFAYCFPVTTTDAGGNFTLKVLVMEGVSGFAFWSSAATTPNQFRYGSFSTLRCPTSPVQVTLGEGYDYYPSGTVTLTASAATGGISWTPAVNAGWLLVSGPTALEFRWMLAATAEKIGFAGPVTYGTVPTGAQQVFPGSGSPSAMVEGDTVDLWLYGTSADGFPYFGSATATVAP